MDYNWRDDIKYVAGALSSDNVAESVRQDFAISMVASKIVEGNGADYYADPDDALREEMEEFCEGGSMTLWSIPLASKLYDLILEWYGFDEDAMMGSIRAAAYDEDSQCVLFATGLGYDIMSADLLGGSADGQAAREFDEFVRQRQA